jgi:single-stranded DNA-specific DHH superfamily exonuclease
MDKKSALIEKFRKFIDSLTKQDIVAVLHHTDPDGVCSGVIMAKLVENKRGKKIDLHINQKANEIAIVDKTVEILRENKVNKLIITDLCIDQDPPNVKRIEKFAEILVIDHHKLYNDISSEKTIFLKPQMVSDKKPGSYPAAKLCLDLASGAAEMPGSDWIAAIGVIGDTTFNEWKDFLDQVFSKYNIEKKSEIFETELGKAASLISNAESYNSENSAESFEIVYNASSPRDVLNSSIQKYRQEVDSAISYWIEHMEDFAEIRDDFIFYLINPKFDIKSGISTRLSLKHPDKTIVIVQEIEDGIFGVSARRRDEKIAVNELLENATEGLEGASAGGHIPAAGAKFRRDDFAQFKKNLMKILKNG